MKINKLTNTEVKLDLISKDVVEAFLKETQSVLVSSYSWLLWYEWVIAKNDVTKEEDEKNIKDLEKQKENVEKKITFFNEILKKLKK